MIRRLVAVVALSLFTGLVSPITAAVAQGLDADGSGDRPVLDPVTEPWVSDLDLSIPEPGPDVELSKPGWVVAKGVATVDPGSKSVAVPNVPVAVLADSRSAGFARTVSVEVLESGLASDLSPFGAALSLEVRSPAAARASWAEIEFELDYDDVPLVAGADAAGRVELVQYSGCVIDKTAAVAAVSCRASQRLESENDPEDRTITFSMQDADVVVPESTVRLASGADLAVPTESTTILAMTTSASSDGGDFSVAPIDSVLDYQVGLFSGSAELSYPIPLPAAEAGPTPSLVLSYSSGVVDGMNPNSNNQSGWIGLGWSYTPGAITRALKTCDSGDHQCVGEDNNLENDYSIVLNGVASPLVHKTGTEFRLLNDPYWKVERHRVNPAGNDDAMGEYWTVTTTDGTVYTFGQQYEPTSGTDQKSVLYTQVADDEATLVDGELICDGLCQRAYQWNLDRVEDTDGNVASYFYENELNTYQVNTHDWSYVRAATLSRIEYGKQTGFEADTPNTRVLFNTEWRCGDASGTTAFSDCEGALPTSFRDTPLDLRDTHSGYSESAPVFFTERRLGSIQTQTFDHTAGEWVTAGFYDLHQWFPANHDDDDETPEVEPKLWLQRIYDRGAGDYQYSAYEQIEAELREDYGYLVGQNVTGDIGGGTALAFTTGSQVRFDAVDFSYGVDELLVRVAATSAFTMEFTTEKYGTPFATVSGSATSSDDYGSYDTFRATNGSWSILDGYTGPIYVKMTGTGSFNWFRFKPDDPSPFDASDSHTVGYPAADAAPLNNRAAAAGYSAALPMLRIGAVKNELKGEIYFTYTVPENCAGASTPLNGSYDNNTYHCYPLWDSVDEQAWVLMNKWVVTAVDVKHPATGWEATTNYEYGTPRWAKDLSPLVPWSQTTWNVFRGHDSVTVHHPDGTSTKHWFYQGMNHDFQAGCIGWTCTERPNQSVVNLAWATESPALDEYWLVGREYATEHLNTQDQWLSRNFTEYYSSSYTTGGTDPRADARFVAASAVQSQTRPATTPANSIASRVEYEYDSFGNVDGIRDAGLDLGSTSDDTFLQLDYNTNTNLWIVNTVMTEHLWDRTTPGVYEDGTELSVAAYYYDGATAMGTDPTRGHVTKRLDWIERGTGIAPAVSEWFYGDRGRLEWVEDPIDGHTSFDYYIETTGLLEKTTNPAGLDTNYTIRATYCISKRPA